MFFLFFIKFFKAVGSSEWFFTNYSFMSGDLLYRVLSQNPGVKITAMEDRSSEMNQLILMSCLGFGMLKSIDYMQNKPSSNGKSKEVKRPTTKFSDIYGMESTKQKMTQIIDYLKSPDEFKD